MAVENFTVNLGTSSPYDQISASIRGRTIPQNGQSFMAEIDGIVVNFEIESVNEKVRGSAESAYSITGRELSSEFLFRPVDFYMNANGTDANGDYSMPTASSIISTAVGAVVYNAPDFRPTQAAMGWKTESWGVGRRIRVREKNVQTLLQKLFGWSADFGKLKICYHVRGGTLFIWELQRATGQVFPVTPAMCPEILNVLSQRIRKFTEPTDTSGGIVTTPTSAISVKYLYKDEPYSGSFAWGDSVESYVNGHLVRSEKAGTVETSAYGTAYGADVLIRKRTQSTTTGESGTVVKVTETAYEYSHSQEGSTLGTNRMIPALAREITTNTTTENGESSADSETTVITHHPLGNGFYGQTATRLVNGEVTQTQHGISRGSPGGAASQYTERQLIGWEVTTTDPTVIPGYVIAKTIIPIEDASMANSYLDEYVRLHGSIERKITADVIGQPALNPVQGIIQFRGVDFYATETIVTRTPQGKRMSIAGVRWDYDPNFSD